MADEGPRDPSLYVASPAPARLGDVSRKAKMQDAHGLGSLQKTGFTPPRMNPGEDSAAYSERVRKAREAYTQSQAMKKP